MKQIDSYETPEGVVIRLVDEDGLPILRRSDDGLYVAHDLQSQLPQESIDALSLYTLSHPGGVFTRYLLRGALLGAFLILGFVLLERFGAFKSAWVMNLYGYVAMAILLGQPYYWAAEPDLTDQALRRFQAAGGPLRPLVEGIAFQIAAFMVHDPKKVAEVPEVREGAWALQMILWHEQVTEEDLEAIASAFHLTLDQLLPPQRGLRATAHWFAHRFL